VYFNGCGTGADQWLSIRGSQSFAAAVSGSLPNTTVHGGAFFRCRTGHNTVHGPERTFVDGRPQQLSWVESKLNGISYLIHIFSGGRLTIHTPTD